MMTLTPENKRKFVILGIVGAVGAFLVIFITAHFSKIVIGPRIIITTDIRGPLADSGFSLSGRVKNATAFRINGRTIPLDERGVFDETLVVPEGYSIITLEAEDRFGKEKKKAFSIARTETKKVIPAAETSGPTETAQTLPV